jgi:flagellar motor switch protein FliN/FliY
MEQSEQLATTTPAQERALGAGAHLDLVLDIPVTVSVELGQSRVLIGELLRLTQGSVVELDKVAGEPLDVLINRRLVARGEAVVVNDKFGVRLTDIISRTDRIEQLKG